jgi:hypothetical protein
VPKIIITETTLLIGLHEIAQWTEKLTWERFAERLAERLGEKRISRHTLLSYPSLVEAFNAKKNALRERTNVHKSVEPELSVEFAKEQIATLEATVKQLERQNNLLRQQFVRWQHNLYMMPRVDMEKLNEHLDKPLPEIKRK